MKIERGMFGVTLDGNDNSEYLSWFNRNAVPYAIVGPSRFGMMDKITVIRFKKYFDIPNLDALITPQEINRFEEYAQLNLSIERDGNGIYVNDSTFQAWQFFKLGRDG